MPIAYPFGLQTVIATSKSRSQPAAFRASEPRRGFSYFQASGTDTPVFWDVIFRFSKCDAANFIMWFTQDLDRGVLDFDMPIRTEFGLLTHTCRFMPDALLDAREIAEVFEYRAQIMTRAQLIPADAITAWGGVFSGPIPAQTIGEGLAFSLNLATYFTGGLGPFTYSVASGELPTGLVLNESTGLVSGTPTAIGSFGSIVFRRSGAYCLRQHSNSAAFTVYEVCAGGPVWSAATLLSGSNQQSVAYGNGRFVVGGLRTSDGFAVAQWSTDGVTWNNSTSALSLSGLGLKNILFANGIFFSDTNAISAATSTDGDTWTIRTHASQNANGGFLANDRFYLCKDGSADFLYTTDGISYSSGTFSGSDKGNRHGAFGNGVYVAFGAGGSCYSSDGVSWTDSTMPGVQPTRIAFGGGIFVAIGNAGGASTSATKYSTDGINWTAGTLPTSIVWGDIIYSQGVFLVSATATEDIAVSTDGVNWALATGSHKFTAALGGGNRFAANDSGEYLAVKTGTFTLANLGAC